MHVEGEKRKHLSTSIVYLCGILGTKIGYEWFDSDWKWAECKMIYVLVHSSESELNKVKTMLSIADHGK